MAAYKVIQDIEADDKLVGPFGIRQFIYLMIVAVSLYLAYRIGSVAWYLALPLLPHMLFFSLLALPFGGEQPTETWLLAKIRFAIKPHRRIWNQSGIQELVTITVPKRIEKHLTKEMSQSEVKSRLQALANTIDSHGWAIKHVDVNLFTHPSLAMAGHSPSADRLIDLGTTQQQIPTSDVTAQDDMLDEQNNPTAQKLNQMISQSSKARRDKLVSQMKAQGEPDSTKVPIVNDSDMHPFQNVTHPAANGNNPPASTGSQAAAPPADYSVWDPASGPTVLPDPKPPVTGTSFQNVVAPDPGAVQQKSQKDEPSQPEEPLTEEELLDKIHAEQGKPKNYGHMRVIKPIEEQEAEARAKAREDAEKAVAAARAAPVTPPPNPDIIELANNDDLNVETIARQANKKNKKRPPDGEVVINLH